MIKSMGFWRVAISGIFLIIGVFFSIAMMNAGHFRWGFLFLDAAIIYALIWPIFVVFDTIIFIVQRTTRASSALHGGVRTHGVEYIYFFINWLSAGCYLLAMMG